jgi:hypothetical protein
MEQVIQFLEEYWGVSIASGVTVGTLITFIVVQVKAILQSNLLRTQSSTQLSNSAELVKQIADKYSALEKQHKELEAKDRYLEQVNLATFKALSYLVVASKLPIEDKLSLQAEFEKLKTTTETTVTQTIEEVKTEETPVINEVVTNVVEAAADLLSKYTGTK